MSELTLKIAFSESLKFECSGNADFVARERKQFYRAAGREKIGICESDATQNELSDPDQPRYAACASNNFGVLTRPAEITEELSNLIFNIQHGIISVKMGDTLSVRLKDGTLTDFVITQIDGDFIRFESVDCIGGKYITRDKVPDLFDDFWELLPDELKAAIVETPRKWIDEDGIENMDCFKLFLPSAPEVFPDDECYGDKGLYEQMEWYKDRRHRLRRLSPDGNTVCWWLLSAYAGHTSCFARVFYSGYAYYIDASNTWIGAPVCFQIWKSK